MKNRETSRAVRNILHNELGVTSEKVNDLIVEYINKKFNEKVETFLNSRRFEYMVNEKINKQISPIVREHLRHQLACININVEVKEHKPKE